MKQYFSLILALCALCGPAAARADVNVADVNALRDGSRLSVSMQFTSDSQNLGRDRHVTYTPLITNGSDSLTLTPVIFAGRNRYIQYLRSDLNPADGILLHPGDAYSYSESIPYQEWMEESSLQVLMDECNCGLSSAVPVAETLAQLDFVERTFSPLFTYVTPRGDLEKTRRAEGSAYIDFPVNRTEIYPDYRRNPEELASIRQTISKVADDKDIRITGIDIEGFASPEGSYANNVRLAAGRAESLADYVSTFYSLPRSLFSVSSVPENWAGLRRFVAASQLADTTAILAIIDNESLEPDRREALLKSKFPQEYAFMLKTVYPGLRRSDYVIRYTVRSYTSLDEIKALMISDPEKLSAGEIFAVAETLDPESPAYAEALALAARVDPTNSEANMNMVMLSLARGENERAAHFLSLLDADAANSPAATYLRGVLAYRQGNVDQAISLVSKSADAGYPDAVQALTQFQKMKLIPKN